MHPSGRTRGKRNHWNNRVWGETNNRIQARGRGSKGIGEKTRSKIAIRGGEACYLRRHERLAMHTEIDVSAAPATKAGVNWRDPKTEVLLREKQEASSTMGGKSGATRGAHRKTQKD